MAPLMTAPIQSAVPNPEPLATDTAMGVISVIVPTEVPIARDTKQLTTKSTRTENRAGMMESRK